MNLKTSDSSAAWEQYKTLFTDTNIKALLSRLRNPVFLDSSSNFSSSQTNNHSSDEQVKYDIISGNPIDEITLTPSNNQLPASVSSLAYPSHVEYVPFCVGFLGFVKYDYGLSLHQVHNRKCHNGYFIGLYTWSIVRRKNEAIITFSPLCSNIERESIKQIIEECKNTLQSEERAEHLLVKWKKSSSKHHYDENFDKISSYIQAGDTYQVNFTQRFEAESSTTPLDTYFQIRNVTCTPYSAYFSLGDDYSVLSFSPERFLRITDSKVKTSPIKGTSENNGSTINSERLSQSTKDKAENLMIVDLLRNDLSKVSKLHSVRVDKLFSLETYRNVHHLVSDISSELKPSITELDAFLTCFPGGSITGAPKKRAMEIIDETEEHLRDAYCGSAFYWNFDGTFDSNILIRTIVQTHNKMFCWGGGGITSGSNNEDEYKESLMKVSNITGINR